MNPKYQEAFHSFVECLKCDKSTRGILFFGSVQQGTDSPMSDLDFYIVVESDEGWNYKKNLGSVPIEAYFLPHDQWMKLIHHNPHVLRAFATGTIIFDTDSCLKELVTQSKYIFNQGPPELSDLQKANWRITLTELWFDLEGLLLQGENDFIFSGWAISKALEGYYAVNRMWDDKPEKIIKQLSSLNDLEISKQIKAYNDNPTILDAKLIVERILDNMGGPITEYEGPRVKYNND